MGSGDARAPPPTTRASRCRLDPRRPCAPPHCRSKKNAGTDRPGQHQRVAGLETPLAPNALRRYLALDAQIAPLLAAIEAETGYPVLDLPREREYFIELRLVA